MRFRIMPPMPKWLGNRKGYEKKALVIHSAEGKSREIPGVEPPSQDEYEKARQDFEDQLVKKVSEAYDIPEEVLKEQLALKAEAAKKEHRERYGYQSLD